MFRYFFNTIQGRIVGLFIVFITLVFVVSLYSINYVSQSAIDREKEEKLLSVAAYMDYRLGEQSYSDILEEMGAANASRDEQIAALNLALAERTDEVSYLFSGLGVGYYSLELDAILTYGPSESYSDMVGVSIGSDHPGRIVMRENQAMVKVGSMVRGNIMNAMHPIVRDGNVIGYAWANELVSAIQQQYIQFTGNFTVFLVIFYAIALLVAIYLSRRMIRHIDTIVDGVKNMRSDLTTRIGDVGGELGEVASSLNQMAEDIEKSVKEREELVKSEAANAAQREFLSRMSHELRTPMNGVLGMAMLAEKADTWEKSLECINKIQTSATLLLGIINDILDFSKIEANKMTLEEVPFDLYKAIDGIHALVLPRAQEKDLSFTVIFEDHVPHMVIGDSVKFSQILLNLIGNAIKFTHEGSIKLLVDSHTDEDGNVKIECSVSDTGIGMTEDQMDLLFKPFSQGDNSIMREYGGTGLGLSIGKALIELMDGEISVESEYGEGSVFSFYVMLKPCLGEIQACQEILQEGEEVSFSGLKALLAEDIEINQEIAVAILETLGIDCDVAENGAIAVEAFKNHHYDLVFMDIRMPVMDGLSATAMIREFERESGTEERIPIIAMTANAMQDDRIASLESGMDEHISKPLDLRVLVETLRRVLKR